MTNIKLNNQDLLGTIHNFLKQYHRLSPDFIRKYRNLIGIKRGSSGGYSLITVTPNAETKKGHKLPDDPIYQENPELQQTITRGFTLVFNNNGEFVMNLIGLRKFTGNSHLDDDDVSELQDSKPYCFDKVDAYVQAQSRHLVVTETTKANGKACFLTMRLIEGHYMILFGSKTSHHLVAFNQIQDFIIANQSTNRITILSILNDIVENFDKYIRLLPYFQEGYTLCGELCDGKHFVIGDNTVTWFALTNQCGIPLPNTLAILQDMSIKTVESKIVFKEGDDPNDLKNVFKTSYTQGEGSVLYFTNTQTGESMCCKLKSPWYIVKRMLRQILLARPVEYRTNVINSLIEKAQYTRLSTDGNAKVAKYLLMFVEWFIHKKLPFKVLSCLPLQGMESIPYGFAFYWDLFLKENQVDESTLALNETDFGTSNPCQFRYLMDSTNLLESKLVVDQPTVLFTVGGQGLGKSMWANALSLRKGYIKVEQDECRGDTKTCQTLLKILLQQGKNCVVSRCNMNLMQYKEYLNIAKKAGARIIFIGPNHLKDPLAIAIGLAGILKRSQDAKKGYVCVGMNECGFDDAIRFTISNYVSKKRGCGLDIREDMNTFDAFTIDRNMRDRFKSIIGDQNAVKTFVETNVDILNALRLPPNVVHQNITDVLNHPTVKTVVCHPFLVTLKMTPQSRLDLFALVNAHDTRAFEKDEIVCEHLTVAFNPKSTTNLIEPSEMCMATATHLVIDNRNGASAFRVSNVVKADGTPVNVLSGKPHITACLNNSRPMDSLSFVYNDNNTTVIEINQQVQMVSRWS